MNSYLKELLGKFLITALCFAVTLSLIRSSNIHQHMAMYMGVEILAFILFPFFGAFAVAVIATFAAAGALMITGELITLPSIAAFWLIAFILNSFISEFNKRKGEFLFERETLENEITEVSFEQMQIRSNLPLIEYRLSRYRVLSEMSLKLTTTLQEQEVYFILKEYLDSIFPEKTIKIIASPRDMYSSWVNKNSNWLLVENTGKDYRFTKPKTKIFSLIESPLLKNHKVSGSVRVESKDSSFTSSDLRMLGTVSNMATIALEKSRLFAKTKELALTDSLSGLYTHTYFIERLTGEINRAARYRESFTVLMIDIDRFKEFNDDFGHQAGDKVLKEVSDKIKETIRETDIAGRYGGEEFSVVLLNTDKKQGAEIAEKLRKEIEALSFCFDGDKVGVTATVGGAVFPDNPTSESILISADRALYKGKKSGRNKVVFAEN